MNQSESNNEDHQVNSSPTSPQDRHKFPEGMRVLAVDDNKVCLTLLERLLRKCSYEVELATDASTTLKLLKEKGQNFHIVIIDVHMPEWIDGLKLLEIIGLEMDIPVVMMSADDDKDIVLKAINHGACDYLVKPVRMQEVKNIWQHVIRRTNNNSGGTKRGIAKEVKNSTKKIIKREREQDEDDDVDVNGTVVPKKPRFSWTQERHARFIAIVSELGVDNAAPSKILEKMGIPGLTRQQVASHLQKFRSGIKKTRGHETDGNVISTVMDGQLAFTNQYTTHFGHHIHRTHSVNNLNNLVHLFPQALQAFHSTNMKQVPLFGSVPSTSYVELYDARRTHLYPIFDASSSSRPFEATEFVDPHSREFISDPNLHSFEDYLEGSTERNNIENIEIQNFDENFMSNDGHSLIDEHAIDDLETEYLMQHNACSSPDEDLDAIVRHSLQSPP